MPSGSNTDLQEAEDLCRLLNKREPHRLRWHVVAEEEGKIHFQSTQSIPNPRAVENYVINKMLGTRQPVQREPIGGGYAILSYAIFKGQGEQLLNFRIPEGLLSIADGTAAGQWPSR